jgi:hypothetical protein
MTMIASSIASSASTAGPTRPRAVTMAALAGQARLLMRRRGWYRGGYLHRPTGAVDLLGALALAAGARPGELPRDRDLLLALYAVEDELVLLLGVDPTAVDAGEFLARWQDQPARTLDQVDRLLADLIAALAVDGRPR